MIPPRYALSETPIVPAPVGPGMNCIPAATPTETNSVPTASQISVNPGDVPRDQVEKLMPTPLYILEHIPKITTRALGVTVVTLVIPLKILPLAFVVVMIFPGIASKGFVA
jgi:hypothetical protein